MMLRLFFCLTILVGGLMPVQAQDLNVLHEALDTHAAAIEPDVMNGAGIFMRTLS